MNIAAARISSGVVGSTGRNIPRAPRATKKIPAARYNLCFKRAQLSVSICIYYSDIKVILTLKIYIARCFIRAGFRKVILRIILQDMQSVNEQ